MSHDDIIRMAREAGATPYTNRHYPDRPTHTFTVEQLDALLAAEREACAKVAEDTDRMVLALLNVTSQPKHIAAAIRARGLA